MSTVGTGGRSDHGTPSLLNGEEGALSRTYRRAGCGLWPTQRRRQGRWRLSAFFKKRPKWFVLCLKEVTERL